MALVEVTLEMTQEELLDLIDREFTKIGKFDDLDETMYKTYIHDIVKDGSATLFFGPTHLRTWLIETIDRLEVIEPWNSLYDEIKERWENNDFDGLEYSIVGEYKHNYLIEHYN